MLADDLSYYLQLHYIFYQPIKFREDDVLCLIRWRLGGEVDVRDYVFVLRKLEQEVIRDGTLSGSSWTNEEQRTILEDKESQEVTLTLCVDCVNDDVIQLWKQLYSRVNIYLVQGEVANFLKSAYQKCVKSFKK